MLAIGHTAVSNVERKVKNETFKCIITTTGFFLLRLRKNVKEICRKRIYYCIS